MRTQSSFISLKKNAKKDMSKYPCYRLAIVGDSATQNLAVALRGVAYENNLDLQVLDSDYNQIMAQLFDKESETYKFSSNAILVYCCSEKLYDDFVTLNDGDRENFAESVMSKIESYWSAISANSNSVILQYNFVDINDDIFGNYASKIKSSFVFQLRKLNVLLTERAISNKQVYIIDINSIQSQLGRNVFYDSKLFYIAKMPISMQALPYVAEQTVDVINSLIGRLKKCVILDLDNTIWGGVISEDGIDNIEIGDLGSGQAFSHFQQWLKELKNRGIILAVCSKNDEETAKSPFVCHKDMILQLDDISVFVANWNDKATNIRKIKEILNINFDSMVFIDDNPFERNLVKEALPNVTVPNMPEDPALYISYLESQNLFETISYNNEDKDRTKQYQAESARIASQSQYVDYNAYLKSLNMKAVVKAFDNYSIPRVAQLTQRSNQFNLRTIRYTELEIAKISADNNYITRSFELNDKFGAHGLIGVVILKKLNDKELFLDTLLMSCRVLKRGMEEFIFNFIINVAKNYGFSSVIGEYIPTQKNDMVKNLLQNMGFVKNICDVNAYKEKECFIEEER